MNYHHLLEAQIVSNHFIVNNAAVILLARLSFHIIFVSKQICKDVIGGPEQDVFFKN